MYDLDTMNSAIWELLSWISRNNKDEQDAILEYTYALQYISKNREVLTKALGHKAIANIEAILHEHISDEEQHSQQLTQIYVTLSKIPISKD